MNEELRSEVKCDLYTLIIIEKCIDLRLILTSTMEVL